MSQYLGDISAYALAVSQGYTGTEEEYAELMASYATVGQTAVNAAQTATTKASEAATSATTATNKATEATTAATTATNKASEAQTSTQTASNKASEASQSATTASQKATEASQSATTASNKASEASGYATSASQAKTDAESARDSTQRYASDAQGYANDAQASAEGISASASQIAKNSADILKAFPTDTASGAIASFSDGADDLPLKSLVVNIDPVQDLSHGDPSPENICPISGWTGCEVSATGINIWDEEWEIGGISYGDNISETDKIRSKNYIPVVSGNTYFFYCETALIFVFYYDSNKNYLRSSSGIQNVAVTIPERCRYIRFRMQTTYGTTYNHDISINYPSTDHDYYPYTGRSITIDLGQTVYGGKLDVLSGKLTVYPYYASYNGETLTGEWISDRDVYAVGATPTIGAQVVNIGAEGTEIQLESHEVASLLGANNIFADTGDCTVEYRADTKLYINKKIAEAISALS